MTVTLAVVQILELLLLIRYIHLKLNKGLTILVLFLLVIDAWLGHLAYISSGALLGSGSIVDNNAYVPSNCKIPSNSFLSGNPV